MTFLCTMRRFYVKDILKQCYLSKNRAQLARHRRDCLRNGADEENCDIISRMRRESAYPVPSVDDQPVKSPVSNPPLVMRFALTGCAREKAAAALNISEERIAAGSRFHNPQPPARRCEGI